MKKHHLPTKNLGEHLGYFEWFTRTFDARRVSPKEGAKWRGLEPKLITTKLHPSGIGMIYSKARGTELVERVKHPSTGKLTFALLNARAYQEGGNISGPYYTESMSPEISERIAWWKDHSPAYPEDFRRKAILTAILNYEPHR